MPTIYYHDLALDLNPSEGKRQGLVLDSLWGPAAGLPSLALDVELSSIISF